MLEALKIVDSPHSYDQSIRLFNRRVLSGKATNFANLTGFKNLSGLKKPQKYAGLYTLLNPALRYLKYIEISLHFKLLGVHHQLPNAKVVVDIY